MATIKDLINLRERCALVTGATGGIGKVIAETLAELGADLILVDRPGVNFQNITESLSQKWCVEVQHRYCDLEQQEQRDSLILSILSIKRVKLNIIVNNAAFVGTSELSGWSEPFESQTIETWRRAVEVNLTAPFHLCKELAPLLSSTEGGSIINIASVYGKYGPNWQLYEGTKMSNPAAYAASKGGLIQLTRWLSTTLAPKVRVNSISPGGVFREQPQQFVDRYVARTPLGRMASEDDLRGAIAYLASDLSKYVTGQNIMVDGGWGVW